MRLSSQGLLVACLVSGASAVANAQTTGAYCDLAGRWEDQAGAVYDLSQEEKNGTVFVKGTLRGSARSGHPDLRGALEGNLVSPNKFKGTFRNWEKPAGKAEVESLGKVTFTVSHDGKLDGKMVGELRWSGTQRPIEWPLKFTRAAGEWPAEWPKLPDAYVKITDVSNGCGPGKASEEDRYADTAVWHVETVRYEVDFRPACLIHDAGYSGAKTDDIIDGGIVDFFPHTQKQVDTRFEEDLKAACRADVRRTARQHGSPEEDEQAAINKCYSISENTRHTVVRALGDKFAWKKRPDLRGRWLGTATGDWFIDQTDRVIKGNWMNVASGLGGEFRGTLISYDKDSAVQGTARITQCGKRTEADISLRYDPKDPDRLHVSGGVKDTLARPQK